MSFYDLDFANHHAAVVAQDFGRLVSYVRGNSTPILLTAVPKQRFYNVSDSDGSITQVESWDWLITRTELGFDPWEHDKITETLNDRVYKVMRLGDQPAFTEVDSLGQVLIVHSKRD